MERGKRTLFEEMNMGKRKSKRVRGKPQRRHWRKRVEVRLRDRMEGIIEAMS